MIHIGFTGTQSGMTQRQGEVVWWLVRHKQFYAHHGDCVGADAEFHAIVKQVEWCYGVVVHPPTNASKRAFVALDPVRDVVRLEKPYLERNHDIVDESTWLIATPKEDFMVLRSGTWSTVRYARSRLPAPIVGGPLSERKVLIVLPSGAYFEEAWR
jgi:hypothetical protein